MQEQLKNERQQLEQQFRSAQATLERDKQEFLERVAQGGQTQQLTQAELDAARMRHTSDMQRVKHEKEGL